MLEKIKHRNIKTENGEKKRAVWTKINYGI